MIFADVYSTDSALITLYQLLQERKPEQNISHEKMPTWEEHVAYIAKRPVPHWYLIEDGGPWIGSIYLSRRREIGIWIFSAEQRKGYGTAAVHNVMLLHPGEFYANVAPMNLDSHAFFNRMDFKITQATYKFRGPNGTT